MNDLLPDVLALLLVGLPALPLLLTVINLSTWRRPRPTSWKERRGSVSILIPARNEAKRAGDAIRSALSQGAIVREVLVYSDGSTDGTDELVRTLAAQDARIRLLRGEGPPLGWVGKPHACQRLLEAASGVRFLFMDADVRLLPGGLAGLLREYEADKSGGRLLTAVPAQRLGTFFERLVLPLLHLTYVSWLPLRLAEKARDPRMVAANGQLMLLDEVTARRLDGFRHVAHEITDDVALARHAKKRGIEVRFADASLVSVCRMYESASEVWRGFSKNLYEGLGSPLVLAIALALHLGCFLLPYLGLFYWGARFPTQPLLLVASGIGVLENVVVRALLARRYGHPGWTVLAHPMAVLLLVVLALWSFWVSRRGEIEWAGRRYAARKQRGGLMAEEGGA